MDSKVRVTSYIKPFTLGVNQKLAKAKQSMAFEILSNAIMLAPKSGSKAQLRGAGKRVPSKYERSGKLKQSGRVVQMSATGYHVIFGGSDIPYAEYQERGARKDGSHVVRNYTTSGTGAHYLERAGDKVKAKMGITIRKYLS